METTELHPQQQGLLVAGAGAGQYGHKGGGPGQRPHGGRLRERALGRVQVPRQPIPWLDRGRQQQV